MTTSRNRHDAPPQTDHQVAAQAAPARVRAGPGSGSGSGFRSAARSAAAISAQDWVELLEVVAAGGVHLVLSTPGGARVALVAEQELVDLREVVAAAESERVVLTAREREVLVAVEEGLAVAAVAERLGIAQGTAVQHLAAARRKFGVRSSAQAAWRAREAGQLG